MRYSKISTNSKKNKQKKRTKRGSAKSKWWTAVKLFLIAFFSLIILGLAAGGAVFVYYAKDAPALTLDKLESKPSTKFTTQKNTLLQL
ncbi:Penicillin-binding protein 1A [Lactococcus lactis]|nr:Penicillin-binding protein 1A [Lactococcus lactis]